MRVEKDSEYLSDVSQKILVDALVSDNAGFKFLELKLLGIFVEDSL